MAFKLIGVVPGCEGTIQFNMVVHNHNLIMDNDNEGLMVGKCSPDLINPKEDPISISEHSKLSMSVMATTSSDVVNRTVACTEAVPSKLWQ